MATFANFFAHLMACSSKMTLEDFDDHQLSFVAMSVLSKDHLCTSYTLYVCQHAQLRFTSEGSSEL